jgi:acylphosphatase
MVRAHLLISGIVQGVGYRWSCRREGRRLGVTGWVRNLDDGREMLIRWCYRGPEEARVTDIAVTYEDPVENFVDFEIG